jgi:8-oxo-dGTP pyrophosphatase MutT (NUDIX family)
MTDVVRAAGAVLWRPMTVPGTRDGTEVLLVHRAKYDDWSLPKGKMEPGEHILQTAVREVFEETSVHSVLGLRLPTVEYQVGDFRKRIDYWSVRSPDDQAAASHEIDEVCWLPLPLAVQRLTYPRDVAVLDALQPRTTVPLILLRHASAGEKASWPGDDQSRPLDARGRADALRLAALLAFFAPQARVLSSTAVRCTETVRPYAETFGGVVEAGAALALHDRAGEPLSSRTDRTDVLGNLVRDLLKAGRPAVVCLHRENLPKALAAAYSVLDVSPPEPPDPSLHKGGFWVMHATAGELAGLERYEPE